MDVQGIGKESVTAGTGAENREEYGENSGRNLNEATEKELQALKLWLFSENIRIQGEQKKLLETENRLLKERMQFQEEMKILNQKVTAARQRLKQEEQFFEKKMEILKDGFSNLEADRRAFDREKEAFRRKMRDMDTLAEENSRGRSLEIRAFFAGVKNQLALKKRYKDLLKIYHPDNLAGDKEIMQHISRAYEDLKRML
jgi:vacuolar-type H+-ATPase subunit I/STV1